MISFKQIGQPLDLGEDVRLLSVPGSCAHASAAMVACIANGERSASRKNAVQPH